MWGGGFEEMQNHKSRTKPKYLQEGGRWIRDEPLWLLLLIIPQSIIQRYESR